MPAALLALALGLASSTMAIDLAPIPDAPFAKPDGPIRARLSDAPAGCTLVLMDAAGAERGRAQAKAGDLDLAALLPALRGAERAMRVQAVVDGTPVGAPLVVVPLEVRPTIRTVDALRPDGATHYTRIVGWGNRLLDESDPKMRELRAAWPKEDPTPRSGFRVERDRDVVFETTAGRIRFAMRPDCAPATARNFVELAERGFYDGTIVHRIVPKDRNGNPFVIQGGDPTGTGDGGPGYDIPLEPSALPHDFGVVSMARNDWPDSAGSQWFVGLSREGTARLDGQYCAFGEVVEGAEALVAIAAGEIGDAQAQRPKNPVTVTRAFVQPSKPWIPGTGRPEARVVRPAAAK
ncbi:MAG: peptidylprolyl isomerase [Phycisphaerales bacterium]